MPSYISNIQVPPTITMSEHVAAHDPHPKYLLAENLVSSINVQVSLKDLNDILIEENAELNNTVLVHNSGSWEPVSVSTLLVSAIPYATTENSGTVKLAIDEDIASKNTATVVTPNLLYPYFTRYDSAINELSSRADSAVTRIPVATESLPGIARLATENDINNNTDSTIVTPPLLNGVSGTLSAAIDLKQNTLTAGAMIDAAALDNNTVEVTGAQPALATNGRFTELVNGNTINCTLKGGTNTEIDPNTGEINCTLSNISKLVGYISPAIIESTISEIGIKELTKGCLLLPFSYTAPDDKEYQVAIEWGLSNKISIKTNTHRYLMIDNYGYYKFKKIIYALLTPKPCDTTQSKVYKTNFTTDIIEFYKYNGSTAADNANANDEESIASILMYFNQNSTNDTHSIRCKWIVIGLVDKNDKWQMQFNSDVINGREKATKNYINGNSIFPIATGSGNSEKLYLLVDSGDNTIVLNDPEFTLSTEEETAGPVTVTITYDSEATFCAYSLDNETWAEVPVESGVPTTKTVTFTSNGYIYARCNKSIDGVIVAAASSDYEISNIINV